MNNEILVVTFELYGPDWKQEQADRISEITGRECVLENLYKENPEKLPRWYPTVYHSLQMTLEEAFSVGQPFTVVERTKSCRIEEFAPRPAAPAPVNERCNVVVAGTSVMEIREVMMEQDLCTDLLQGRLRDGWRILAICVQPDQRRPDYILGKV